MPNSALLFLVFYFLLAFALFVYGAHAYLMTWLYHRHRRRTETSAGLDDDVPFVTVQLPLFNEIYVVRRLVDAVCAFDYPRDRFEIQLLDDSTDDTVDLVREIVAEKTALGYSIAHIHRTDRKGFKGGALREGLDKARGDLIAVFDADFVPPAGFLSGTVPRFRDPSIGMVQTRWGHLNEGYSLLTRIQAMALDGHFLVEQTARNRSGVFINFNGTAGIWRRQAILDAGNWQDDTLTEDLDLSYRAQLAGWRFLFLPDLVCPAELPAEVNGFKGQQFRWAKGSVQTAVKLLPAIFRSRRPAFLKFQAFVHLTNHAVYPLLLALAVMTMPALALHDRVPQVEGAFRWATVLIVASLGHPFLYMYSQKQIRRDWPRQLAMVPVMIAMGMGIALNNVRAIIEALAGIRSDFNRTPKYDLKTRADGWKGKKYRVPSTWISALEILLGLYTGAATVYSVLSAQYLVTPFLFLYSSGFLYVGVTSLRHARLRNFTKAVPHPAAPGA